MHITIARLWRLARFGVARAAMGYEKEQLCKIRDIPINYKATPLIIVSFRKK